MGAVVRAVVDVEALGQSAAQDRLLEHGQEGGGVLCEREGGVGDDAGGIVEEGDEVGLVSRLALDGNGGAVHDVAHPAFAGAGEGEAAPVVARGYIGALTHQPLAREDAVHGRGGEGEVLGQRTAGTGVVDDGTHG